LIFADLEQIDRNLPALVKRAQVSSNKDDHKLAEVLSRIQRVLQEGKIAYSIRQDLSDEELKLIRPYNFLTMKPFIYAINVSQEDLVSAHRIQNDFMIKLESPVAVVSARLESEMMDMTNDDKQDFITELLSLDKVTHIPTLDDLIALAFNKVGLMYYFTT
jgi:ribosome-binding ATPase